MLWAKRAKIGYPWSHKIGHVKYHTMYRGCKINKAVLKYHSALNGHHANKRDTLCFLGQNMRMTCSLSSIPKWESDPSYTKKIQ